MKLLAFALGIVFLFVAVLYSTGLLQLGASHGGRHPAHAILFCVLGLGCFVWARFQRA